MAILDALAWGLGWLAVSAWGVLALIAWRITR